MKKRATIMAILAAFCYGISAPISKILLGSIPPVYMAALLYLGAGMGISAVNFFNRKNLSQKEAKIAKSDLIYVIGMIVLDIAAPIFLMLGLSTTSSANASLINNFEIVVTAVIALLIFKEHIGKRMWLAILLITISSIILSIEDFTTFQFSIGSLFVLAACVCWGFENNCTRMLSLKSPLQIVIIKGFGSGIGALIIALFTSDAPLIFDYNIIIALLLGFVAYGMSIYFYIYAQRHLGAARTSAYYAFAPFIGVALSFVFFDQAVTLSFIMAALIMIAGTYLASVEKHEHSHIHEQAIHEHRHNHNDGHHSHTHNYPVDGEHSHEHIHEGIEHSHSHTPDMHHVHSH